MQKGSVCIAGREEAWREARKAAGRVLEAYPGNPETYELEAELLEEHAAGRQSGFRRPANEEMRELYCSIGRSECADLDSDRLCICPDCAVWAAGGLKTKYFCLQGPA